MQGIPRALSDVGDIERAQEYERGCEETRARVIEQLHQYDRQFPFALIPEISIPGSSLHPISGEITEINDDVLESSAVVRAGESGLQKAKTSHAADVDETSDWCLLDASEASAYGNPGLARKSKFGFKRPSFV